MITSIVVGTFVVSCLLSPSARDSTGEAWESRSANGRFEISGATWTRPATVKTPAESRTSGSPVVRKSQRTMPRKSVASGSLRGSKQSRVVTPAWVDTRSPAEKGRDTVLGSMRSMSSFVLCMLGDTASCPATPASSGNGGGTSSVPVAGAGGSGGAESGGVSVAGVSLSEYTVLPIAASRVEADLGGFGLRNGVTNVWAVADEQELEAEVLGRGVLVRAKPISYSFDYGDGSATRVTSKPGGPLPDRVLQDAATAFETETATSHRYTETGTYSLQVVTTFTGEYQVAGGGWVPIPGTTQVASDPFTVDIWRTKHLHVSGPCVPGQKAPGCPG